MRTRKRGGRVIGEGGIARVIYPAIPCKDGRSMKKYTSRVVTKSQRRKPERDLVSNNTGLIQKLREIDPGQKYLIYPDKCEVGDLLEENIADGVTEDNKHLSEFLLKAGITWREYSKKKKPSAKQKAHIIKAIELLHKHHIIHGDLYSHNIVIADDNLPRLIDFGNSVYDAPDEWVDDEKLFAELVYPQFLPTTDTKILRAELSKKKYELMREQQNSF
jgi:serine/threonine protein kinase